MKTLEVLMFMVLPPACFLVLLAFGVPMTLAGLARLALLLALYQFAEEFL